MADSITVLKHSASGASCRIHAYGATILSFRSSDGRENLFVSRNAVLDGTKPIRGGIPIVFPIFGPPQEHGSTMPQHGFARRNVWKLESVFDKGEAAGATYSLSYDDVVDGCGENNSWSKEQAKLDGTNCKLVLEIRLQAKQLTTTLHIQNTGSSAFNFQALFHTYYKVENRCAQDGTKTFVSGLGGYSITDQVDGSSNVVQTYDEPVVVRGETDRIYIHPEDHPLVHAKLALGTGAHRIQLETAGQVDEQVSSVSCVVWNPGKEKAAAMADFVDDEYQDMLCVEPGLLGHQPLVPPGAEAQLTQSIIVLD